jgi:hypothetical protein
MRCNQLRARLLQSGVVLVAALASSAARANNAFPDEFTVLLPPAYPHRIMVGANFGLLTSEDDGQTWHYTCEPWITQGSSGPLAQYSVTFYDLLADGAVLAASNELTSTSGLPPPNFACTWPVSTGPVQSAVISDIFADPTDPTFALASIDVTSSNGGGSKVIVSHDGGKTFDAAPIYDGTFGGNCGGTGQSICYLVTGIESSRSSPGTMYATTLSLSGASTQLLKFTNYGANLVSTGELPPPPQGQQAQSRILLVDPTDANKVYIRMLIGSTDSVYVTSDGTAATATKILQINGLFSAFLLGGDGTVYAGTMDGVLYTRPPNSTTFTPKSGPSIPHFRCLGQRPGESRIYACGDLFLDNYSLGYSDDHGQTFTKMMKFTELLGPVSCSQVQTACAAHWARIQDVLCFGAGVASCSSDAGTGGGGGGGNNPGSGGGSHCGSVGAGASALFILLAFWARRARRWS